MLVVFSIAYLLPVITALIYADYTVLWDFLAAHAVDILGRRADVAADTAPQG